VCQHTARMEPVRNTPLLRTCSRTTCNAAGGPCSCLCSVPDTPSPVAAPVAAAGGGEGAAPTALYTCCRRRRRGSHDSGKPGAAPSSRTTTWLVASNSSVAACCKISCVWTCADASAAPAAPAAAAAEGAWSACSSRRTPCSQSCGSSTGRGTLEAGPACEVPQQNT
jgi:hypothetical protein